MQRQLRTPDIQGATAAPHLDSLNIQQRRAVEHGCDALDQCPCLLIIAGAGSGKTNTLAYRVAHLVVSGADPRRIMLLTFSRRATIEMQRRVERITAKMLGPKADAMTDALAWSGTFHAIGARMAMKYESFLIRLEISNFATSTFDLGRPALRR
jgi:DNA helicase-2/ATP-dependent DNA helicase PcrA